MSATLLHLVTFIFSLIMPVTLVKFLTLQNNSISKYRRIFFNIASDLTQLH
jgi:hypothetical protein